MTTYSPPRGVGEIKFEIEPYSCPKCRHERPSMVLVDEQVVLYVCQSCGHEWTPDEEKKRRPAYWFGVDPAKPGGGATFVRFEYKMTRTTKKEP